MSKMSVSWLCLGVFQIKDTAVFMGLMVPSTQQQHHLQFQLHHTVDELISSRHSSASDVSLSAADSPTHAVDTSQSVVASAMPL